MFKKSTRTILSAFRPPTPRASLARLPRGPAAVPPVEFRFSALFSPRQCGSPGRYIFTSDGFRRRPALLLLHSARVCAKQLSIANSIPGSIAPGGSGSPITTAGNNITTLVLPRNAHPRSAIASVSERYRRAPIVCKRARRRSRAQSVPAAPLSGHRKPIPQCAGPREPRASAGADLAALTLPGRARLVTQARRNLDTCAAHASIAADRPARSPSSGLFVDPVSELPPGLGGCAVFSRGMLVVGKEWDGRMMEMERGRRVG